MDAEQKEAGRAAADVDARIAALEDQIRLSEARADKERAAREAAEARADEERAAREAAEAHADEERAAREAAEARMAPSQFLDYIRNAEEHLYATFYVEPNSELVSSGTTTRVDGKVYPQFLRPWTGFAERHAATFAALNAFFANEALFPSLTDVLGIRRDLSPDGAADEVDLRPFIRSAIERPAAAIVSEYLSRLPHPTLAAVKFRNNAYGIKLDDNPEGVVEVEVSLRDWMDAEAAQPPRKRRRSPVKQLGVPDRWGFSLDRSGERTAIFVGEYKAAHKLTARKLRRVMAAPPGENFFARAIRAKPDTEQTEQEQTEQEQTEQTPAPPPQASVRVPGHVSVAHILCQAYHYMVNAGLEYGYVASGDGLIFLRVPADDPRTLYYFWSVFPVAAIRDQAARRAANIGARTPQETALAYAASFCLWATESTVRSPAWIDAAVGRLARWPTPYEQAVPAPGDDDDDDDEDDDDEDDDDDDRTGPGEGDGGGQGEDRGAAAAARLPPRLPPPPPSASGSRKRTHSTLSSIPTRQRFPDVPPMEPPTLPYCTQACLLGLVRRLPLDSRCPNAALHRAAHGRDDDDGRHHPLTVDEVRARIVAQLDANMNKACESLDRYGLFGAYGALFKLEVTGFGYTFVAKGVQTAHRRLLQREAGVYEALAAFQGRLVPVFLGLVDLVRPFPLHSCARVPHMMLLSYAGVDLCRPAKLPVDAAVLEHEAARTVAELAAAGLWDDDEREANMVWNEEVGRVMRLDFDQARVVPVAKPGPEAEPRGEAAPRSPLLQKRNFNGQQEDGGRNGDAPAKRVRTNADRPS